MKWVETKPHAALFLPKHLTRVVEPEEGAFLKAWENPMTGKVLVRKLLSGIDSKQHEQSFDPNRTTILGGMCLVNTLEMKLIYNREIVFGSSFEFEEWYANWYPRIDQVHDAVGIPPRTCKKIIYVSEDSFFAKRLASYTGLDRTEIQDILHRVHEKQGHPVLERYLKALGYTGDLVCVYTSDIEKELEIALRMWERILGHTFRTCDRDFAKVELMYTGFWLDILGIKGSAVIYEAASKLVLRGWVKLDPWFEKYPYGSQTNRDLGIMGYLPFLTTQGDGSKLHFNQVPNFSNHKTFVIAEEEILWYIVNLLFTKDTVMKHGPQSLEKEKAVGMIKNDLSQYFL